MENKKPKSPYVNGKLILERLLAIEVYNQPDLQGNKSKMTIAELMHVKMVQKALDGDLKAYAEVLDRMEGKAVQKVEESVEHTFVSKPLSELVQFVKPTKTIDYEKEEVVELIESDSEPNFFMPDIEKEVEIGTTD